MNDALKPSRNERGISLLVMAISATVLVGFAGMSVDLIFAYLAKTSLRSAVDSAVLASLREPSADRATVADGMFRANFPAGHLASTASHSALSGTGNTVSMTGTAVVPTFFMKMFGYNSLTVKATATGTFSTSGAQLLILDEDAIDNGHNHANGIDPWCGGSGVSARCINDDIANLNLRTKLFTRQVPASLNGLVLKAGQTGDWGWFKFGHNDPQVSQQNGAQFTTRAFVDGTGVAANENNLDKITDVTPLYQADLVALIGKTVCVIAYDSDISLDLPAHYGSLKGSNLGKTAFTVTAVGAISGSNLGKVTVNVLTASAVDTTCNTAYSGTASTTTTMYLTN